MIGFALWCSVLLLCAFSAAPFSLSVSFSHSEGLYCNATTDQIGTCWPRASAGKLVERPCPEFFNGIKYNTTSKCKLLSFSGTSDVEKSPGDIQIISPMKKKEKKRKEMRVSLGINISSTFQPVCSKFLPGMMQISQNFWLLDVDSFLVNRVWADWVKMPPSIQGGCIVLAVSVFICRYVWLYACSNVAVLQPFGWLKILWLARC